MATLTGKIADVTGRAPDSISSITVKAPSARVGSGTDVIVSSPAEVTFDKTTGDITISGLTGGLSWLYIEGGGWSDSIPLAVAEGMITLVEAIANAAGAPGLVDYIRLLDGLENRVDDIAQGAVDDAAAGIKYVQPALSDSSNVDELTSGMYPVPTIQVATAIGMPNTDPGELVTTWLDSSGVRRRQTYYVDKISGPDAGLRVYRRWYYNGVWQPWTLEVQPPGELTIRTETITEPGGLVNKEYVDSIESEVESKLDGKASTDLVNSVSDTLNQRIDDENWYRGTRSSSTDLDTVLENGEHIFTAGATNAPAPGIGTLLVVGSTSYKIQTWNRMGNNVTLSVHRRYYSGGNFTPWQQLTMRQLPVSSSGDLNSLTSDGYYPINTVSAANQPSSNTGILWVVEHSTSVYQQFTDSEGGLFIRHKSPSGWKEWKSLGVDTLKLKDEIKTEVKGEINAPTRSAIAPAALSRSDVNQASYPASMTADRTIYFNGQNSYGTARYSEDLGATWKNIKSFHGSFTFMEEVGDGELLARITGDSRNEIWRSIGWPELKEQCEWEKVLEAASPGVYFTNSWGVSIHKNIVLIAEYGPKYVPEALPGIPQQNTAEGENARYLNLSLDYGKTFRRILDINEYATSQKGDTINVHLHGVAWDPWWDRIWVTCGDSGGAFLYSDDLGATWHTAWDGWAANASGGNGHQCVGIVPMPHCVLFATDSSPNGVMRINRSEGKHEGTYSPESAYVIPEDPGRLSHLAQRAYRVERDSGDYLAMFVFGTETMAGKSFALATYDGYDFTRFWQDDQEVGVGRGARTMIGPTLDGQVIIGSHDQRTANMWGMWKGDFSGY